jgi:uncharacterized protein YegP (UPF0339 family)
MDTLELYAEPNGDHRWRLVATENGRILADSGEGYRRKRDALKGAGRALGISEPDQHPVVPGNTYVRPGSTRVRVVEV